VTKTAIIVQARMGSSRLPGKVLLPLAGHTVLWHTLTRCAAVTEADLVCCAIPMGSECDPVADEATQAGATVSRGSENDVLARYLAAANEVGADVILRVTSDCPVIDPEICADVLRAREQAAADYASNNMPRRWPHGLDCEAFTRDALARAAAAAYTPDEREHVTPWLRNDPSVSRVHVPGPNAELARHRWTLDFPEDYKFFEALFALLQPSAHKAGVNDILSVIEIHPEIQALNAHRQPNAA
jgi:spore coat polysaccharide biosynthesis protein SpsF